LPSSRDTLALSSIGQSAYRGAIEARNFHLSWRGESEMQRIPDSPHWEFPPPVAFPLLNGSIALIPFYIPLPSRHDVDRARRFSSSQARARSF
jgi:hypothetical protein